MSFLLSLITVSVAATCASVEPVMPKTNWDADRAWMHAPGWFVPLKDPQTEPAVEQSYAAVEPMIAVHIDDQTRAWPVRAMAYHHVANDRIGNEAVVVTY